MMTHSKCQKHIRDRSCSRGDHPPRPMVRRGFVLYEKRHVRSSYSKASARNYDTKLFLTVEVEFGRYLNEDLTIDNSYVFL